MRALEKHCKHVYSAMLGSFLLTLSAIMIYKEELDDMLSDLGKKSSV